MEEKKEEGGLPEKRNKRAEGATEGVIRVRGRGIRVEVEEKMGQREVEVFKANKKTIADA